MSSEGFLIRHGSSLIVPPFSYTGKYSSSNGTSSSDPWKIKFLTTGTFTPKVNMTVDIFLVGGGGAGAQGTNWAGSNIGNSQVSIYHKCNGSGGGGGYTKTSTTVQLIANQSYTITIGSGGSKTSCTNVAGSHGTCKRAGDGTASSIMNDKTSQVIDYANGGHGGWRVGWWDGSTFDYTGSTTCWNFAGIGGNGGSGGGQGSWGADNNNSTVVQSGGNGGSNGGNGERSWDVNKNTYVTLKIDMTEEGKGQGSTTREFGESSGALYAYGGGGAPRSYESMHGYGGGGSTVYSGWGGRYGTEATPDGSGMNGAANTGNGGGGGMGSYAIKGGKEYQMYGGNGGSGIVIIRNHKT